MRRALPEDRTFKLPGPLGWFCNLLGIAYTIVTTIFFLFPPDVPATASNMNYCVVAFGIIFIVAVLQWILDSRKTYKGPKIEIDDAVLVAPPSAEPGAASSPSEEKTDQVDGIAGDEKYDGKDVQA